MNDTILISVVEGEDKEFADATVAILDEAARALDKPFDGETVQVRAEDGEGRLLGGLVGSEVQGWLYVKLLAVAADARNFGLGGKLLSRAEDIARARGFVGIYLDTFDFQAPRFYLREGFTEIGRLPAIGGKPQRIWFVKTFDNSGSAP
ncbi:GNAT family N-acetyltransferase [Rhizobium sp. SL42]|uniref:GNAT family N-acetyltransferase n=1 Tax=Rhizobium sp. SL42 TaxID=2806346 RepID=UPI001F351210|nr:GNAT family N-acetyltransferase [Rhizobium sp. SL42]UJW73892.1 GNAT family N-acetyltransferase [Rhizobium sp. SL42]